MIDVKELRIGNWVMRKQHIPLLDGDVKYLQVTIRELQDCQHYGKDWAFEPIPLTPDILGKIKGCMVDIAFCGIGDFIIIHYYDTQKKVLFNGNYVGIIHLQYLHQLQNLYSCLTGKELEIEL